MILKDCYATYLTSANNLHLDWKNVDINDLVRDCIAHKNTTEYDHYLAAICCRYWKFLEKLYAHNLKSASDDECYAWLIEAILYALNVQPWLSPKSSLHNSKNAPERVIFRRCECNRLNFYAACNRSKRVVNYNYSTISIESYYTDDDETEKSFEIPYIETKYDDIESDYMQTIISDFFACQDYLPAFILDIICMDNTVFDEDGTFNRKRLRGVIAHLDDWFCEQFAEKYNVSVDICKRQAERYNECSSQLIYDNIEIAFAKLKYCFKKLKLFQK